jgi:hypothetical protein
VSPVRYDLAFYIPEDCVLHSHCRENPHICPETEYHWSKLPDLIQHYIHNTWQLINRRKTYQGTTNTKGTGLYTSVLIKDRENES